MGYRMDQRQADFRVDSSKLSDMLSAIKNMPPQVCGYAWVDDEFRVSDNIFDCFGYWRWFAEPTSDGSISDLFFQGEKLGDEDLLFATIAPFVDDGSFIEMDGENGAIWRWVFKNGKVRQIAPTISWADDEDE